MESLFALLVQRRGGCALILAHRDKVIQHAGGKWHRVDPPMPLDAFPQLVPPIEAAWRLDGTPRTACQCPV